MKLIHKFKSTNFNKRKNNQIFYIILHYTALPSIHESIKYLCEKKNKVSCHYIVAQNGEIYNLVSEKFRAWHAGQSEWLLVKDLNNNSIGIELDFSPNHSNNKFTKPLLNSLIKLIKYLKRKYKIDKKNILAHSDIAPYRKIDPGETFPWNKFNNLNLTFYPKKVKITEIEKLRSWFKKNLIYSKKKRILIMLSIIGYDISKSINSKIYYKILIKNYRNHFFQYKRIGNSNFELLNYIEFHFYNILLTKT